MQIPGVIAVGFGYKQRLGITTQELSLRVYVRTKQPRSSLAPSALIPEEVNGFKTDVIEEKPAKLLACESLSSTEPLVGGITIGNLKAALAGSGITPSSIGTLGALTTLADVAPRDNIGLLSNNHVLGVDNGAVGDTIYNPQMTPIAGGNYSIDVKGLHPIGQIHDLGMQGQYTYTYAGSGEVANSYYLDCASAKVSTNFSSWCHTNIGTSFDIRIHDLAVGGADTIEGIARITEDDLPQGGVYTVYKVGRSTGKTTGKVVDVQATTPIGNPAVNADFVIKIENTGPNCGDPAVFADHGDSGSVLVNGDRKVIGLIFAGNPTATPSTAYASHIHPVLDRLNMTLLSTANNPNNAGTSTLARIPATLGDGAEIARAAALRAEIVASERGRLYHTLVGKHLHEIQHLINRVRPVTVAWHRLRGPDFAAHVLHASRHAEHVVPRALYGQSRDAAFAELLRVVARHGSAALRQDIEQHADELSRLLDGADNIEALASALRAR